MQKIILNTEKAASDHGFTDRNARNANEPTVVSIGEIN